MASGTSEDPDLDATEQRRNRNAAHHSFGPAYRYAGANARSPLVVLYGLMGTGETSVAQHLREVYGWHVISTDAVRKHITGVGQATRVWVPYAPGLYSSEKNERTYDESCRRAGDLLDADLPVVVDGACKTRDQCRVVIDGAREHGAGIRFNSLTPCAVPTPNGDGSKPDRCTTPPPTGGSSSWADSAAPSNPRSPTSHVTANSACSNRPAEADPITETDNESICPATRALYDFRSTMYDDDPSGPIAAECEFAIPASVRSPMERHSTLWSLIRGSATAVIGNRFIRRIASPPGMLAMSDPQDPVPAGLLRSRVEGIGWSRVMRPAVCS